MDILFSPLPEDPAARALADHARRQLHFVLRQHSAHVGRIEVRLGGSRSRRGLGASCYCHVRLHFAHHALPPASVVDVDGDAYAAVDRAAGRAARLAEELLQRARWPAVA